eukprot:6619971-Ditylum_brightwellii.AAC.1
MAFHLKNDNFIEEYHIIDPFLAGYDLDDAMSKQFNLAPPDASPEDILIAWFNSMAKNLGSDGQYLSEGMPPANPMKAPSSLVVKFGGSLIFNDYNDIAQFSWVSKEVKEEAACQNIEVLLLDGTSALISGKKEYAKVPKVLP